MPGGCRQTALNVGAVIALIVGGFVTYLGAFQIQGIGGWVVLGVGIGLLIASFGLGQASREALVVALVLAGADLSIFGALKVPENGIGAIIVLAVGTSCLALAFQVWRRRPWAALIAISILLVLILGLLAVSAVLHALISS